MNRGIRDWLLRAICVQAPPQRLELAAPSGQPGR